ncbi:MAG: type II toxin-antitoxin system VapC family toxin [Acidobacteriota bacterium]
MRYLLDSDIVTGLYDQSAAKHSAFVARLASLADSDEVFISILTLYEFEYGLANAPVDKQELVRRKIVEAQNDFGVLSLSAAGAVRFGALKKALRDRRSLSKESAKKYNIDLILAATALVERCTLVSGDAVFEELRKVQPDLELERWA